MTTQPLSIANFNDGMADSPHLGLGLLRNIDIDAFTGAAKAQKAPETYFHVNTASTFTAIAATDICTGATFTTSANTTAVAVVLTTTGTLPAGLATATIYFIIRQDQSAGTFKLATTVANANAGTAIDITDTGTGTHTVTTINPGQINHIVRDPRTGDLFWHDANGRVWYGTAALLKLLRNSGIDTGGSITQGSGQGLAILGTSDGSATYLFAFRNALIDVINIFGTSNKETPVWTNGWQALNSGAGSGNSHQAINGQDGIIYYCDDRYIGSIKEVAGQVFDPATGATYTFNQDALDTPQYEILNWLEELGTNILAAGDSFDKIYPWDRISDSFNIPLIVPEKAVKRLKNIGGIVYILAGTWGNVYVTQGNYVRHFKKIPESVTNNSGTLQLNPIAFGGIDSMNGALIFGMSVLTSGNSGVYLLYPDGRILIDNMPASGSANVTAILARDNFYRMGFASGANGMTTTRYAAFESVINSQLYRVGTKTRPATYSVLEVQLAKPASSGQVRVGYRTDTSSSFTTLSTFATDGAATSFKNDSIGLINIENIQVQAEFDGTVELMEIRLLP